MKPSRARERMTARPRSASRASISVTVLNLLTVSVIWRKTSSGAPRLRSTVATGVPACWRTASSPMRRPMRGSPVIVAAASNSATASSCEIQLPTSSR